MAQKKATKAAEQAPKTKIESTNTVAISGRVCERGIVKSEQGTIRFSMGHNMGPKTPTLFVDVVMFPKNGKKAVEVPADLIEKGASILVKGYLKPGRSFNYKNAAGEDKALGRLEVVALSIENNPAVAVEA